MLYGDRPVREYGIFHQAPWAWEGARLIMMDLLGIATAPPDDAIVRELLKQARSIAVVGLSPKPERDSNMVARYLLGAGYNVIPVNPGQKEILGVKCFPDLGSIGQRVDIVDVFRRSEFVPPIARQAVDMGARALWLQLGVRHDQAAMEAAQAGLVVMQDSCIKVAHARLLGKGS